ncbi:MAG: RlmE family RNA methyltransferase [Treponema sp.]|nr:RlmE family RNA methyltransferase [Treponema sp.]
MADYKKADFWQLKARKEGYPARSVYKLKEIDEKFNIFNIHAKTPEKGAVKRILDIGAAPGSWSLYVLRKLASGNSAKGFLAAADLSPLSREFDNDPKNKGLFDGDNFFFIQGDVTTEEVRNTILSKGLYGVIISDVAPGTTGSRLVDAARSLELSQTVISYVENALVPGGNLVLKVFQGDGIDELLKHVKTLFKTVKTFKPQACRGDSMETYFIGLEKK